jgi:hypothetical protein
MSRVSLQRLKHNKYTSPLDGQSREEAHPRASECLQTPSTAFCDRLWPLGAEVVVALQICESMASARSPDLSGLTDEEQQVRAMFTRKNQ